MPLARIRSLISASRTSASPFPGKHLLEGVGSEADLRPQFYDVQKDNFLDAQRFHLVQTLGQLLRLAARNPSK